MSAPKNGGRKIRKEINTMSENKNYEATELNLNELEEAVGGKFKKPDKKDGFDLYQIQKGDTLYMIAKTHGYKTDDLLEWNPKITDRNKIYVGDWIYIKKK